MFFFVTLEKSGSAIRFRLDTAVVFVPHSSWNRKSSILTVTPSLSMVILSPSILIRFVSMPFAVNHFTIVSALMATFETSISNFSDEKLIAAMIFPFLTSARIPSSRTFSLEPVSFT